MAKATVVKQVGIVAQVRDGFARRANRCALYPFGLQSVAERFRRCIIQATAPAAYRSAQVAGVQPTQKFVVDVLTTTIRVVRRAGYGPSVAPCHRQCIGHGVRGHARLEGPAYDLPFEPVQCEGEIWPAFISRSTRACRQEIRASEHLQSRVVSASAPLTSLRPSFFGRTSRE